ncbi:MAG: hypothetical protein ACWA5P_03135 [bacterium]
MNANDTYYFELLKEKVCSQFLKTNSAPISIKEWKGDDITLFQEDLFNKVKAKVSEKWFYTYFKHSPEKLPRIDMLNLLSNYIDYKNWNDFLAKNPFLKNKRKKNSSLFWLLVLIPFLLLGVYNPLAKNKFQFCFIDDVKGEPITDIKINITVLPQDQSPLYTNTNDEGCFIYKTRDDKITFIINSPFHKSDTIIRHIDSNKNKIVKLTTDDYALMLDYYTNRKLEDWKQRKKELDKLISDDAQIYELFENNIGVTIYSKDDFIRMLTIPTNSLKRINILDKKLHENKIVKLKFIVQ